ncbi:type VII toxin-antitoxin system MntA family adenylyltransferase antitoxin [Comamonas flocculans]|uniref:type VII toxin-antitoxin system MntA family adenylyltransferase antitoxin n=1 Tax=Comamonas flocculans TaxID=2597701 RepID=UPI001645C356|nr:nucleotidyltransferase domain-containing protein [Comamonas flocculans]
MSAVPGSGVPSDLLESLRAVLRGFPSVRLAVLFDSTAQGRARADSDLDLAVDAGRALTAAQRLQLVRALAQKTGRAVDLVDLTDVGVPLLGQIARHGKRVVGSSADFGRLIHRSLIEEADFMPLRQRMLDERRRAWIGR